MTKVVLAAIFLQHKLNRTDTEQIVNDVLNIEVGVVGLSFLHFFLPDRICVLIESNSHLFMGASSRSTENVCTSVDARIGSLEYCLIRDFTSQI